MSWVLAILPLGVLAVVAFRWVMRQAVGATMYRAFSDFVVEEARTDVAPPAEIPSFLSELYGRREDRFAALGFRELGYLYGGAVIRARTDRQGLPMRVLINSEAATLARQLDSGRADPAWPFTMVFETHLADGTKVVTLEGFDATLHATKLSRIGHSRGLTLEEMYADHREAVREAGVPIARGPETLDALAAEDCAWDRRRLAEVEESGLVMTAEDGSRRFRPAHVRAFVRTWLDAFDAHNTLTDARQQAEQAAHGPPPPLPSGYLAYLKRGA